LDRSKWVPQTRHSSGTDEARACNVDDPRNVSVSDGALRLTVRKAAVPAVCDRKPAEYTAGNITTYHKFSQQYGRFEARVKSADAAVPGLQESFWLWPDDRESHVLWGPMSGEIDIAETYSHHPKLAIPYLHTAINTVVPRPGLNTAWDCRAERGAYNTYTLTWTRKSLAIDVNGETCLVNRSGNRAFHKKYIAAFTSALGTGNHNALTPETPMPATMSVDYFRVWR
jgi:beta-glucanase (GH16 family)